jgi:hypothetical protein
MCLDLTRENRLVAVISPSPVGVAHFWQKSVFKKYSKMRPLGLTLNLALAVGARGLGRVSVLKDLALCHARKISTL